MSTSHQTGAGAGDETLVIGVAQRVLMQLHGYTVSEAASELRATAQDLNMRVVEVAAALVAMHLDNSSPAEQN
jgi:AmiR/NasT family two-component response regulator